MYIYIYMYICGSYGFENSKFPPKKRGANGRFQLPCASLEVPGPTGSMMNPMGLCGLFFPDGLRMVEA